MYEEDRPDSLAHIERVEEDRKAIAPLLYGYREQLAALRTIRCAFSSLFLRTGSLAGLFIIIHDLWSACVFSRGYAYSTEFNQQQKSHDMLEPYSEFTYEQKAFEDALCVGGLKVLYEVFGRKMGVLWRGGFFVSDVLDFQAAVRWLCLLADQRSFLLQVASPIHENWRRTSAGMALLDTGDARLATPFSDLSLHTRATLLQNIRSAIVALAFYFVKNEVEIGNVRAGFPQSQSWGLGNTPGGGVNVHKLFMVS